MAAGRPPGRAGATAAVRAPCGLRCASCTQQCALALLVYVSTATILELYWMSDWLKPSRRWWRDHNHSAAELPSPRQRQYLTILRRHLFRPPPPPAFIDASPPPEPAADNIFARSRRKKRNNLIIDDDAAPTTSGQPDSQSWRPLLEDAAALLRAAIRRGVRVHFMVAPICDGARAARGRAASERVREWPADRRGSKSITKALGDGQATLQELRRRWSSPELLLYKDGALIDGHEAVFRANLAVTGGFEEHAGRRTAVRVINPVESHRRARKAGGNGDEMIIKNQDPPAIRSPSREHSKFLEEMSRLKDASEGEKANYLARRHGAGALQLSDACVEPHAARRRGDDCGGSRKGRRTREKVQEGTKEGCQGG